MRVESTELTGVVCVTPVVRTDGRGSFHESWQLARYADSGLPSVWVQDNVSTSARGVLRGLHFQHPAGQGKLVSVLHGAVLDVAVDIRSGSPQFGRSVALELSAANARQLWIPPGFAHGFLSLVDGTVVSYKCTEYYRPEHERTLAWDDPVLAIQWPMATPSLSDKDSRGRRLAEFAADELPSFRALP